MKSPYPGVTPQKTSIRIEFSYKGVRCRESIKIKPTSANLKLANQMREGILFDIAVGRFDYANRFPNSKNTLRFSNKKSSLISIDDALTAWLIRKQAECQYSTIREYSITINKYLSPIFGTYMMDEIKPSTIKNWLTSLSLSNKRKNNILIPLRGVYEDAYYDEVIDRNPMDRVKNLPVNQREPHPFNLQEISAILSELEGQERNLFQFAFWSGLRTSELIALQWEDVDFDTRSIYVRKAVVNGREKPPKTNSGIRTVELNSESILALKSQKSYTANLANWVFHDPKHNTRWKNENPMRKRVWINALQRAQVKYRNPYQTRHTFASMMLSSGKNPLWVAQQMGHSDWGMIRKVYGRWIGN